MHLLTLCMLYALGLKTKTRNDGKIVVTSGGEFKAGLRAIQKLRDLATFFRCSQRLAKLKQLNDLYYLPAVNIEIDFKNGFGYDATLMRRSVKNTILFKMQGLTDQSSQFSFGVVQRAGVASSFDLSFRKIYLAMGAQKQ
ncbi:hypothetical protein PHMEG_00018542 [Phytophthora megakarya]|uniref:Uncharacterized protein n=1 Tax=Phytophthora megakarya TaxID=4795 RepID=A0A225VU62_9STRA|nr:hypothetical protein PHMEG_00018542 [Phytophthora megakarya]